MKIRYVNNIDVKRTVLGVKLAVDFENFNNFPKKIIFLAKIVENSEFLWQFFEISKGRSKKMRRGAR